VPVTVPWLSLAEIAGVCLTIAAGVRPGEATAEQLALIR
jgi:hypothetical protein